MTNFLHDLPWQIQQKAINLNISTPEETLRTPKTRFMNNANSLDLKQLGALRQAAAAVIAKQPARLSELTADTAARISFGCKSLDHACGGGGIVNRGITEIYGEAGSGKTQLLYQLALSTQLPVHLGGLAKSVAFICTEGPFNTLRLLQISQRLRVAHPDLHINFLANVHIEHVYEPQPFFTCIMQRLRILLQRHSIGLIIIDSVAAIFRQYANLKIRATDMRKFAHTLLSYSNEFDCAIICINQVAADVDKQLVVPCLGTAWSHLVRTRLRISKLPKEYIFDKNALTVRKLEVIFAPEMANTFAEFLITSQGIVDLPET